MAKYDHFKALKQGGPYDSDQNLRRIYKCEHCDGETHTDPGWNGSPDLSNCTAECRRERGDWRPGSHSRAYKENYDRIFPDSPGAGL